ncbi:hypothetical protein [Xanthomonas sp. XNM01]|uniref:hypothetical protein n=1 Tax=Xanthomonas sp. XNM01 TaxID=2769289 RepID=UPI001CE1A940|nr:hypothetical protein [Xanthomonas sp. XNM01]
MSTRHHAGGGIRQRAPYWFPAKTHGIGWGVPDVWQGWAVLLAYVAGTVLAAMRFPPGQATLPFAGCIALLSVLLIAVCCWKGEPILAGSRRRT